MKNKWIKKMVSLVLAAGIIGICVLGVQASNNADSTLTSFEISCTEFTLLPYARNKTDASSVYVYITNLGFTYAHVQARGANAASGITMNNTVNETYSLIYGTTSYVRCWKGSPYAVHSLIYEDGYPYATLAFHSGYGANDHVTGYWSPDSTGTYPDAN